MEIVINAKHGGYSISALGVKELAKLNGKECYFFNRSMEEITTEEASTELLYYSYSINNPQDYRLDERDEDGLYKSANERADKISLDYMYEDRSDLKLIEVVKKLGDKVNTRFSKLKIVEIPDGTDYQIEEYDGMEWIAEKHETWC